MLISSTGLTAPGVNRMSPLSGISEQERVTDSDAGSVVPATVSAPIQEQEEPTNAAQSAAEADRLENAESTKVAPDPSGMPDAGSPPAGPLPTPPSTTSASSLPLQQQSGRAPGPSLRPLFLQTGMGLGGRGRGLPTGPRGRLEISNPLPQSPDRLTERILFQRPRPAPLVLQDSNDSRVAASPAENGKDGWYF